MIFFRKESQNLETMAAQENLFGFDVDVEEVDKEGKPFQKEQKQHSGPFDKKSWKEWKKTGKHMHKAAFKGHKAAGIGFFVALAALAIFSIPAYVWAGIAGFIAYKVFSRRRFRAGVYCKN